MFAAHPDEVQPGTTLLTLLVPADAAPAVAAASADGCGGGGEGAGVVIVSVCSDKGSPGVTTLATVLGLVWPGRRAVVEADTAGSDLSFRLRPTVPTVVCWVVIWRRNRRSRPWPPRPGWA